MKRTERRHTEMEISLLIGGKIKIVKMVTFTKAIYSFKAIPIMVLK